MLKLAEIGVLCVFVPLIACGDDGGAGGAGGTGGVAAGGSPAGGGGATAVCEPQFTITPTDCTDACIPLGNDGNVYCTNVCETNDDCRGPTECAASATAESLCLPPCEPMCPSEAFCDDQTYPGFCVPIGL